MHFMISVSEAIELIQQHTSTSSIETLPIADVLHQVLANDICSIYDIPAFNQSGMDGYAFRFQDFTPGKSLLISGESAAGNQGLNEMLPQQAVRIFTGAPVPDFADTVVMQEKTTVIDKHLFITAEQITKGSNVRAAGSEITKSALALPKGTRLTPAAIGLLAAIGEIEVPVYRNPTVAIIITGDELQIPGLPLEKGKVYDSNSFMLIAALQQMNIDDIKLLYANDDLAELKNILLMALETVDVVLLTGGVSVGDYDFVLDAAEQCGVEKIFHKIKQKPGKPMFFGTKNKQLIFGLPGNPSSVLTCFYKYVVGTLQNMQGFKNSDFEKTMLPIAHDFEKKEGLTHFLKATSNGQEVRFLGAQESFRLSSFAIANCLACVPENTTQLFKGDLVEMLYIDGK